MAQILIYPIGPGQPRKVTASGFALIAANLLADGKRIWFYGNEPSGESRVYLTSVEGEKPRPLPAEGLQTMAPFATPDGKYLIARLSGKTMLLPFEGGQAEPLLGVEEGERTTGWASDSQSFFTFRRGDTPTRVYRLDRKTGRRSFFQEIGPSERAGISNRGVNLHLTADGKSYVYSVEQNLSELYLVTGLK